MGSLASLLAGLFESNTSLNAPAILGIGLLLAAAWGVKECFEDRRRERWHREHPDA